MIDLHMYALFIPFSNNRFILSYQLGSIKYCFQIEDDVRYKYRKSISCTLLM
jgi:hypothetical protein